MSARFHLAYYQQGYGIPLRIGNGFAGRGFPDIAGNASANSGYTLNIGGTKSTIGGTSMVAPLYAGLFARINSNLGISVGFVNEEIYQMAATLCRDVNPLSTNPPTGPINNNYNNVVGYPAGPGWDACTGWGSLDGTKLQDTLKSLLTTKMVTVPLLEGVATLTIGGQNDGGSYTFVYQFGHLIKVIHNPPIFGLRDPVSKKPSEGESALLAISALGNILNYTGKGVLNGGIDQIQKALVEQFKDQITTALK